ncbi:6-phospho-3-hexuloisomerase [Paenibacillus barcinonensis]|uniref:6-phospho-3-hexuloisomerase n=1 Tax=Paenibacillus barcinonensis TaxID=198119 RepID=A0A2V4VTK2_PAEBA|nr:6-phospho-3-hexuloisomerase [Paenibacillus barcinonensis]PYE50120.1 6-phospho-3-hexuloisomerase [Paenibacillus barcinonensis]QKS59853.1 6-phospho-3-hexuloisomerase [Paenibacillus barcinonensis]
MSSRQYAEVILKELARTLSQLDDAEMRTLAKQLLAAKRIFVAGAGRSGLMGKALAMRLMQMGLEVYVVGETVTPGISSADFLLLCSGSGETGSLVAMARKAIGADAAVGLVTIKPESTIAQLAQTVVVLPASAKEDAATVGADVTMQPMGSLFEQSLLVSMDALILTIMEMKGMTGADMFSKHANLE